MLLVGVSWRYVFLDVHYQCEHVKLESDLSLHIDLFSHSVKNGICGTQGFFYLSGGLWVQNSFLSLI
jgi:hypothetical protein